jgi:hypothetical protein
VLVELWGAGGAGAAGTTLTGGAGGGGGAYARVVVATVPGQIWFISVGQNGGGAAGANGGITQLNSPNGGFVAAAYGGTGAVGTTPGAAGMCDISGPSLMQLCRPGAAGSTGVGAEGGTGGRAAFGTIEPLGATGGAGGAASPQLSPGLAGGFGYALVSW